MGDWECTFGSNATFKKKPFPKRTVPRSFPRIFNRSAAGTAPPQLSRASQFTSAHQACGSLDSLLLLGSCLRTVHALPLLCRLIAGAVGSSGVRVVSTLERIHDKRPCGEFDSIAQHHRTYAHTYAHVSVHYEHVVTTAMVKMPHTRTKCVSANEWDGVRVYVFFTCGQGPRRLVGNKRR